MAYHTHISAKTVIASILLLILLCGCESNQITPPIATPDIVKSQVAKADELLTAQDYEGAAVAYRALLDQMEESQAPQEQQESVRERCTEAMVEAGGFSSSQRLWDEMGSKNPESKKEADRMKARAERMMIEQGRELLIQAGEDLKEGHQSKALATARATQELFQRAKAGEELDSAVLSVLQDIREQGKSAEVTPTPSQSPTQP